MITIRQDFKYQGENWWKWWAWIDGSSTELDKIELVTWMLHPTFHVPVRESLDRESKFKIETEGWGIFTLKAKIKLKDGSFKRLEHELVLEYPDGTQNLA